MQRKVIRPVLTDNSTYGKLYLNHQFYTFTCENTVRHLNRDCSKKIKKETIIDAGKYEGALTFNFL